MGNHKTRAITLIHFEISDAMKTRTKIRLFAATLITFASTAQSCELDKALLDEWETIYKLDDGSFIKCPAPPTASNARLLYIEKVDSTNKIIRCAETCDSTDLEKCVPLTDSRCDAYQLGLERKICPKTHACLFNKDTGYYCGQQVITCKTDAECVENHKSDGWTQAVCEDNKCKATACNDKTHLKDGTCAIDTDTACGNENLNCNIEIEHSTSTRCVPVKVTSEDNSIKYEKQCEVLKCKTGYHVSDNVTNNISSKCDEDSITNCGGINCTLLSGWSNGECNQEANCQSNECLPGYHPYNKVVDGYFIACIADTDQDCGKIGNACQSEEGEIRGCIQGECVLRGCLDGYHKSTNHGEPTCKLDSVTECGAESFDCTKLSGVNLETAKCISPTICADDTCLLGYHSTNEAGLNPCEADTNENCGSHGKKCPSDTPVCTYNTSETVCASVCDDALTLCDNGCYDTNTSVVHCGNEPECGVNCTIEYPNANVACKEGQCIINSCTPGYHKENGFCTQDTIENCGGTNCNSTAPSNATSRCNSGKCLYECKAGFAMCDGICMNLEQKNFTSCGICKAGYGNCDANNTNGCETNLEEYGLETCETCSSEYTACGNVRTDQGHAVPLCLKQGHYYKNYEGDSKTRVSCHNEFYKYHKDYSKASSSNSTACTDDNTKYINYDYIGEGYLETHFYQYHYYKLEGDGWNSEKFAWSSEHCALACAGNWNVSSYEPHTDASGNKIEAWAHPCQPKQECDQFDTFEVNQYTTNNNKFYFDYGCSY